METHSFKKMQDKIEKLEKEISILRSKETELQQLEIELQQAQKMEALATLAGGIAHDFNNILQTILGNNQLLLMKKDERSPDYKKLLQIQSAAQKGSELTKHLLTLGKKAESKFSSQNLNNLIKEFKMLLERTIPKMIKIELNLSDNLKEININRGQIEQIIMNLSINARDAMPDGGKLSFKTENVILDSDIYTKFLHNGCEYVRLTISDTGVGMTTEEIRHIFEPFYTTKGPGKGTGLGLAMVYYIVKNHGGRIECLSKPGKGTAFKIYFPISHLNNGDLKVGENKDRKGTVNGTEKILLVDDENFILETCTEIFEKYGYRIITAQNGEDAISLFSQDSIDLVILDIGMPGMGGIKCLNRLLAIDNNAKIIISSGYSMDDTVKDALKAGAKAFVAKPYLFQEMLKTVRKILDNNF